VIPMGWLTLLEARAVAGMGKERLLELLLAGDVKLRFRNPNGTTSPVPPDWLTRATVDWANSRIVAAMPPWFQGPVEVDRQTLLANVADAAQPHGKSGGRPRRSTSWRSTTAAASTSQPARPTSSG
jgi:hypothetical protein